LQAILKWVSYFCAVPYLASSELSFSSRTSFKTFKAALATGSPA